MDEINRGFYGAKYADGMDVEFIEYLSSQDPSTAIAMDYLMRKVS